MKILISDMAMCKETILTQGCELPLGAFQLFFLSSVDAIEFHDDDDDNFLLNWQVCF